MFPQEDPNKELPKDELIRKLTGEVQRLLGSHAVKRRLVAQLQSDLAGCRQKMEALQRGDAEVKSLEVGVPRAGGAAPPSLKDFIRTVLTVFPLK